MKAYRYNPKNRSHRRFNDCRKEKNPNAVKYYALSLEYAQAYKYIFTDSGDIDYECTLEVADIENLNIFNMAENYKSLATYQNYIAAAIATMLKDYTYYLKKAKKATERKIWEKRIAEIANEEKSLESNLIQNEFQALSDFDWQNELIKELRSLGFNSYKTKNEIAIF